MKLPFQLNSFGKFVSPSQTFQGPNLRSTKGNVFPNIFHSQWNNWRKIRGEKKTTKKRRLRTTNFWRKKGKWWWCGVPYLAMHDPTLPLGNSPNHHHFTHIFSLHFESMISRRRKIKANICNQYLTHTFSQYSKSSFHLHFQPTFKIIISLILLAQYHFTHISSQYLKSHNFMNILRLLLSVTHFHIYLFCCFMIRWKWFC